MLVQFVRMQKVVSGYGNRSKICLAREQNQREGEITASAKRQENFNPNLETSCTFKFFPPSSSNFYPLERKLITSVFERHEFVCLLSYFHTLFPVSLILGFWWCSFPDFHEQKLFRWPYRKSCPVINAPGLNSGGSSFLWDLLHGKRNYLIPWLLTWGLGTVKILSPPCITGVGDKLRKGMSSVNATYMCFKRNYFPPCSKLRGKIIFSYINYFLY